MRRAPPTLAAAVASLGIRGWDPGRWEPRGRSGMELRGIGPDDLVRGVDPASVAALGVPMGSPDGTTWLASFADFAVATFPWADERGDATCAIVRVREARAGDASLDPAAFATGQRDRWLNAGEVAGMAGHASTRPGMPELAAFVRDVATIEDVGHVEAVARRRATDVPRAAVRWRGVPGPGVLGALVEAAGAVPPCGTWKARPASHPGAASNWMRARPWAVARGGTRVRSATMAAASASARRAASARALAHLVAIKAPPEVFAALDGRWG